MAYTQTALGGKDFLLKVGNGFAGAVTFTAATDLVTQVGHGLSNGDVVRFSVITDTTGIVINTTYFVRDATADTFKLAATEGGAVLPLTTDGTGTAVEAFRTVGGLRSTSVSLNGEAIDITNQESSQWSEILDRAGINSVSLSGSGVFKDDASLALARKLVLDRILRNWQVLVNGSAGDYWQGCFKMTTLEQAGDYNNEQTYSISLESSGPVTYTVT